MFIYSPSAACARFVLDLLAFCVASGLLTFILRVCFGTVAVLVKVANCRWMIAMNLGKY